MRSVEARAGFWCSGWVPLRPCRALATVLLYYVTGAMTRVARNSCDLHSSMRLFYISNVSWAWRPERSSLLCTQHDGTMGGAAERLAAEEGHGTVRAVSCKHSRRLICKAAIRRVTGPDSWLLPHTSPDSRGTASGVPAKAGGRGAHRNLAEAGWDCPERGPTLVLGSEQSAPLATQHNCTAASCMCS